MGMTYGPEFPIVWVNEEFYPTSFKNNEDFERSDAFGDDDGKVIDVNGQVFNVKWRSRPKTGGISVLGKIWRWLTDPVPDFVPKFSEEPPEDSEARKLFFQSLLKYAPIGSDEIEHLIAVISRTD